MISKEDFESYVEVQEMGVVNMCVLSSVTELTGLTKEQCIDIMKNYEDYEEKFGGEED